MLSRCLVMVLFFSACLASAEVPRLRVISTTRLKEPIAMALDIRWASDQEVFLAAGRGGVYRYDLASRRSERVVAGEGSPGGFFFSKRLAASGTFLVTGAMFAGFSSMANAKGATLSPMVPFDVIVDLDVYDDTVAILGARRDEQGRWAPEGAIVWIGSLRKKLSDLRPLHYSEAGSGARPLDRCHFFDSGAVRFQRDGSLVVIPGVEPGMFVYDRFGKLLHASSTNDFGFLDRCALSDDESFALAARSSLRWEWMNKRTILDDIIPLPGPTVGLISRRWTKGTMSWSLTTVRDGKVVSRLTLPVNGRAQSFVRADIRGTRIALLIVEYATSTSPDGARLEIMELEP